jgi:hypothetical protein
MMNETQRECVRGDATEPCWSALEDLCHYWSTSQPEQAKLLQAYHSIECPNIAALLTQDSGLPHAKGYRCLTRLSKLDSKR